MKKKRRKKQPRSDNKQVVYPLVTHQQLARARQLLHGAECILCGGIPRYVSFFRVRPEMEKLFGVPPGTTTEFAYPICKDCRAAEDSAQRVEDIILNDKMADAPHV